MWLALDQADQLSSPSGPRMFQSSGLGRKKKLTLNLLPYDHLMDF